MRRSASFVRVASLAVVLSLLGTASAWAKSGSGLDEQPVIRRQLLFRGKRHELTADLGATLADAFARNWLLENKAGQPGFFATRRRERTH